MFENVQFFCICIQSLQKCIPYMTLKINIGIKKRRFLCGFQIVDVGFKKWSSKIQKQPKFA